MSPQADYVVSNGTGAAVRSDINGQLAAIVSNNSGASAPATTYAYQFWADTSTNLLKLRNGANSAFITIGDLTAANLGLATLASPTFTGTATIPTLTVSTAANIPLGSAASPTLYFTGDSNTGLYSPGADQVAISTGGSGRLFINSSGYTSIGNSSPQALVHFGAGTSAPAFGTASNLLYGCTAGQTEVQLRTTVNDVTGSIYTDSNGVNVRAASAHPLSFHTSNTERLRITSAGLVGIGTASAGHKLDLLVGGGADGVNVYNNATGAAYYQLATTSRSYKIEATGSDLRFYDNTGSAERARIDSSGRWLLGTSTSRSWSGISSQFQIENTGAGSIASQSIIANTADTLGGFLLLGKSRGTSLGSNTVVQNNDIIGKITFSGADGSALIQGAAIAAEVDGTPGSNDMPGRLVFSTTADGASSPTERMRIRNDGKVLVNATATEIYFDGVFNVAGRIHQKIDDNMVIWHTGTTGTRYLIVFGTGSTYATIGTITTNGSSTSYNTTSDYRLKENVEPVADGITRLQQLKPSRFNFIADPDKTVDGFIAHEVQAVVPEAITGTKDQVDDEGKPVYQGIDQSKLVPLLTAALQEAVAKIESLEARLTAAGI